MPNDKVKSILKVAHDLVPTDGDMPGAAFRLRQAVGLIIAAVEELAQDTVCPPDESNLAEAGHGMPLTEPRTFEITFSPVTLSVDDIWPAGEAPANPTSASVIAAMDSEFGSTPAIVASEWNLIEELTVESNDDTDTPVTWPTMAAPEGPNLADLEACDEDD